MQARALTIQLLRLAMAASLLFPFLLFAYGSWTSYRNLEALSDERIIRSLDVQREQALKTFQLIDLTLDSANDLVSGMSVSDIRKDEARLYPQLKKLVGAVPVVQSIWIYDQDGGALVTSSAQPPPEQGYSDRGFFRAHVEADIGTYYGQIYGSELGGQPFFAVSRRLTGDRAFAGVIEVSVLPSNFIRFFSTLAYTEGLQFALLRSDGTFLARYPAAPEGALEKLDDGTGFRRTIAHIRKAGSTRRPRRSIGSSGVLASGVLAKRPCTSALESQAPPCATNGSAEWRHI